MFVPRPTSSVPRLAELIDRHQAALAGGIATLLLLALHYAFGFTGFHYDSDQYWNLATFEKLSTVRNFQAAKRKLSTHKTMNNLHKPFRVFLMDNLNE